MSNDKEDLRVIRTKKSIRSAFEEMICEMDYEQITVKELAGRAGINRKTFYLHYESIGDLLRDLQNEMIDGFIERTKDLQRPKDMDKITREFFLDHEETGKFAELIICSGSYHDFSRQITTSIMKHTWKAEDFDDQYVQELVMVYVSQSTLALYKKWITDRKPIAIEEMIDIATALICRGADGFIKI